MLDGDSEERPVLDSRRTDAPDPDDPCTQPGRHLLTAELTDPEGTVGDTPVGSTLLVSVFGDEPDPSPSQAVLATLLTVATLGGLATVLRRRSGTDG